MTDIWEPHAPAAGGLRPLYAEGLDLRVNGAGTARAVADGLVEVTAEVTSGANVEARIEWRVPCVDATALWTPEQIGRAHV